MDPPLDWLCREQTEAGQRMANPKEGHHLSIEADSHDVSSNPCKVFLIFAKGPRSPPAPRCVPEHRDLALRVALSGRVYLK
jgi:hypothetical protein